MLEPTAPKNREIYMKNRETYVPEENKRAGHADRDHYIERLKSAVSTGHLTDEEFEERSSEALHAVTKRDLMVLVADVPELSRNNTMTSKSVRYQVTTGANGNIPFSPWRWGITIFISLAMIILPGPLFSSIFHGLGHAPFAGGLPILLIVFGAFLLLCGGVALAPADKKETFENE